jgi:hypothetical protein
VAFWWLKKVKRPFYWRFQRFAIIRVLCRHLYLVVGMFQKAQYLVVFFFLFHRFFGFIKTGSGFLVA